MSWDCGFKYLFAFSPTLKAGVMCKLQERDDIGRIELVHKLARENCQFLQTEKKESEKLEQQDDEVTMVQVKEQGQSVLVLKKVASCGQPTSYSISKNETKQCLVFMQFVFKGGGAASGLACNGPCSTSVVT